MRAAVLGVELRCVEVNVQSESDVRGLVGMEGIPTSLVGIRVSIKIGADNVPETQVRELAAWGEAQSPVSSSLREHSQAAVEIVVV